MRVRHILANEPGSQLNQRFHIAQLDPLIQSLRTNSPVQRPAIEVSVLKMCREAAGECALSRGSRAINGNDHDSLAPKPLNKLTKVGNDVKMQFLSSTAIPLSATMPRTSVDIARR